VLIAFPEAPVTGEEFVVRVRRDYVLSASEEVLVDQIAGVLDELPKVSDRRELRLQRALLANMLAKLSLPEIEERPPAGPLTLRARKAANARWKGEADGST
jgi:hypothetical protein